MKYLSVKNFEKFQHYKTGKNAGEKAVPPRWIKLYNSLLDDYEFNQLPDSVKYQILGCLLLASRTDNQIPADAAWIEKRLSCTSKIDLNVLINSGFFINPRTGSLKCPIPEKKREEKRRKEKKREEKRREEKRRKEGNRAPSPAEKSNRQKWVTPECVSAMKIKYPQIDVDAELDDFRDYCLAHGRMTGKEAYRDFDAAFRQRLKNDFPKKMKAGFKTPPGQCGPGRNPATRGYAVAGGNGRRSVKPEPAVRDVKPGAYEL